MQSECCKDVRSKAMDGGGRRWTAVERWKAVEGGGRRWRAVDAPQRLKGVVKRDRLVVDLTLGDPKRAREDERLSCQRDSNVRLGSTVREVA